MLRVYKADDDNNFPFRKIKGVFRKWANNVYGTISFSNSEIPFYNHSCLFLDEESENKLFLVYRQNAITIAYGFISYILENLPEDKFKDEIDIYETYYRTVFEKFRIKEAIKPNSSNRNLEIEFYDKYLTFEKKNVEESHLLENYLRKEEIEIIYQYTDSYFKYIRKVKSPESKNTSQKTMNYKKIIIDAFINNKEQKISFISYFKSNAKIAERDNFVEFEDFFNGCLFVIETYKKEIIRKYNKRLSEVTLPLHLYQQAIKSGKTLDDKGEPIKNHIDHLIDEKLFLEDRGYKSNYDYACWLTKIGDFTDDLFLQEIKLHWQDIEQIENAILQAQKEIINNIVKTINTQLYPHEHFNSIDEALNSISIDEKIILHTLIKYSNSTKRSALDFFNDILYVKANYKKTPQECYNYLKKNIDTREKEFYAIIHILRNSIEKDSDFLVILPAQYENSESVQTYIKKENQVRKQLTVHFDINPSYSLKDADYPEYDCNTHNVTDEKAIFHYINHPEHRHLFTLIPDDIEEYVKEYYTKQNKIIHLKDDEIKSIQTQVESIIKEPLNSSRKINEEKLKDYFIASFKGQGRQMNYFPTFIEEIKDITKAKEIAQIALMIYDGSQKSDRVPKEFVMWHKLFCDCLDLKPKLSYKPNKLKPISDRLEKLFNYLK